MKLMIYTINGSKYCAKHECNTMVIAPNRHIHTSSGAIRPSDIAVTVNINNECYLSVIWSQLTPYLNACKGILSPSIVTGNCDLESSTFYIALPFIFQIPPWSLKLKSTLPAIANACRWNYSYNFNIEYLNGTIPSQCPHPDMTLVVWNVQTLTNHQQQ